MPCEVITIYSCILAWCVWRTVCNPFIFTWMSFVLVVSLLTAGGKMKEKLVAERSLLAMEEMQVAEIGSFCWNEACEDYQKVNHGNMIKNGKTDKEVQRYLC